MSTAGIVGLALALAVILVILIVRSLIVICPPNRVAVISGRTRTLSDGRTVGYRILKGGRTLRVPLIEKVAWMGLNTIPLEVAVQNAYSKGAIPLNVMGIANVKVSSGEGLLENAAERFLHVDHAHIGKIAKETLEANLRGVLATMSPEEVNEDRLKFSHQLIDEADDDIKTLGLELDVLKIQNVTDDVNYLESVGRRLTAEVIRDARVAEAERTAESEQAEAAARQSAQIAQLEADKAIVEEQNALRVRTAELEAISRAREEEALVAGETAKAVASQDLESQRIELEKRRVEADVVVPARAELEARQLQAQAEAAKIIEDGKAQVEVFKRLTDQYQAAGADGHDLLVLNMLPDLIDKIVATVQNISIDRVAVVDTGAGAANGGGGGDGGSRGGIPGLMSQLPASLVAMTEQIEAATGVDILSSLRRSGDQPGQDSQDD
ncbi:MAG: SPFH domain-containing protein [Acidimicrobiaceae bacterium]|nr:SPFH domain-containing protein [Acidimicrobiaceae bacterium]MCY4174717.1 SPFH domain-containing protein [Acidimicrobiaceae bacterium]MCY4294740.1 SPFH domain-containing protein [Acidimicrobiaceae bacterium]